MLKDAGERGGFDQVWSLGDLVGYGPDPGPCIDLIRQYDGVSVAGNHDLAAIGKLSTEAFNVHAAAAADWTMEQLTEEHQAYLRGLPLKAEVDNFTLAHGSPRDPVWEYVVSPSSAAANFGHFETNRCLVGHSHIPFICRPQEHTAVFQPLPIETAIELGTDRMIINPGGVGPATRRRPAVHLRDLRRRSGDRLSLPGRVRHPQDPGKDGRPRAASVPRGPVGQRPVGRPPPGSRRPRKRLPPPLRNDDQCPMWVKPAVIPPSPASPGEGPKSRLTLRLRRLRSRSPSSMPRARGHWCGRVGPAASAEKR